MKNILIILFICNLFLFFFAGMSFSTDISQIVLADFNSAKKPNNVNGNFGAWDKDPADFTQYCFESFISGNTFDGKGYSLRLDYDVDSPNPAYNGFWMKLNKTDISSFNTLVIWIKGDQYEGFTKVVKLELKKNTGKTGICYLTGITDKWQEFEIPFKNFTGLDDFKDISEFVIVFEDEKVTDSKGSIFIDDISVAKK